MRRGHGTIPCVPNSYINSEGNRAGGSRNAASGASRAIETVFGSSFCFLFLLSVYLFRVNASSLELEDVDRWR